MNGKKNIYLLAGGNWRNPGSVIKTIKLIIRHTGKEKPVVAYIGTANDDDFGFYKVMARVIKTAGASGVNKILLADDGADLKRAKSDLSKADAVFISGGDVERGMFWLDKHKITGFLKDLYDSGSVFFGLSAGSIMLGTGWVRWKDPKDESSAELFDCTALAPVLCDTHAEKDEWEELIKAVSLMRDGGSGYGIPTGGILCITREGKISASGKPLAHYVNREGAVVREADLPVSENNLV